MNRCINDIFGYCYSKPQPAEVPGTKVTYDSRGKEHREEATVTKCINNSRTCSQYLTHTQLHALKTV